MIRPVTGQRKKIVPLDPDSPAGKAAAEALSQALAEILVAVEQRRAAAKVAELERQAEDEA